jgi:acyl-CoA hydrolase
VELTCSRKDIYTAETSKTHHGLITFVAILEPGKINRNVPPLASSGTAEESLFLERITAQKAMHRQSQQELKRIWTPTDRGDPQLTVAGVQAGCPMHATKASYAEPGGPRTSLAVRTQMLPRNMNTYNSVFGGDLLLLMERVAKRCAQQFLASP